MTQLVRVPVRTAGAGRTDAGVHAAGQVVSFEAPDGTDPAWLAARLNKRLAPEIAIRDAAAVPDSFDARHSARRRAYEYRLYRSAAPDPFLDRFTVHMPDGLDLPAMRSAAKAFIGEHDFSSFCRKGEGSLVRRVRSVTIVTPAQGHLTIRVVADSFCHQMVRSLAGFLIDVGRGKRPAGDARTAMSARDRASAGPVAPAKGLILLTVTYPRNPFGPRRSSA